MADYTNLRNKIITKYQNNDFIGCLDAIDAYLSIDNQNNISESLLDIYIQSQIKLGLFDEAKKNIKTMLTLFPSYYNNIELAKRYVASGMYEELNELLNSKKLQGKEYYILGKYSFYNREYNMTKKMFEMALQDKYIVPDKIDEYLKKIEVYEKDDKFFKPIRYYSFKSKGQVLEPGHIIRADRIREKYMHNKGNTDPLKENRPYLIWKIIGNLIYTFPLSSRIRHDYRDGHIFTAEKYPSYDKDRKIQDKLICIKESDVEYVDDKIDEEDFKTALESIYNICCYNQSIPRNQIKMFMISMVKELGAQYQDIILINDNGYKNLYYILERDNENQVYKALEVDKDDCGNFYFTSNKAITIDMNSNIIDVIRLTNYKKSLLTEQIVTSYTKKKSIF